MLVGPVAAQEPEPPPDTTFQIGVVMDNEELENYLTFHYELDCDELEPPDCGGPGGGRPRPQPFAASMVASITNIEVIPGYIAIGHTYTGSTGSFTCNLVDSIDGLTCRNPLAGVIGGDVLEFDVIIVNTTGCPDGWVLGNSPALCSSEAVVLTAFAFQSKQSESPALGSRIGDKLFYAFATTGATAVAGAPTTGPFGNIKKNGTSNGLYSGRWKGICINSSTDFIPEFNSGLDNETLECAGTRTDSNEDGNPELQTDPLVGLYPGQGQTVRLRLESGTTDGALHVVPAGTLTGTVQGIPVVGPNGITYYNVQIDTPGNVREVIEFGDNKVLRDADGTFNPTFAPAADGLSFSGQQYLTLPRRNHAFTDILGRNHTCETYGLTQGACDPGNSERQPFLHFLGTGDLMPGVQNFAAILHGFGEFYDPDLDFVPDVNPLGEHDEDTRPNYPYDTLCINCAGALYVPIAEFYTPHPDAGLDPDIVAGSVIRQIVGGVYGPLGDTTLPAIMPGGSGAQEQYTVYIDTQTEDFEFDFTQEIIPEPDPGGPRPGEALGTVATGRFYDLTVVYGQGINGGDSIEFTIDISNLSGCPEGFEAIPYDDTDPGEDGGPAADCDSDAWLTAFNYQTKERGLADIGILDGFEQDRRDIRVANLTVPGYLPDCTSLDEGACWNPDLQVGHFPNVIGNGLLFGQMVWTDADAGREPFPVDSDQVYVNPATGIDPIPYWLESVKKNGPFAPILKGNENFICVKSGLFDLDPDADAGCAGEPAELIDPDEPPVPSNIIRRFGLPPGRMQTVRIRMEFGDFRGALLRIEPGTLTPIYNIPGDDTSGLHPDFNLQRFFDCSDQRELEYCHPELVGTIIGYLPNTSNIVTDPSDDNPDAATWLTPETLEEIEFVIINQPGDAPTIMNFEQNLGYILQMAGFIPTAEFYAPDPRLAGHSVYDGVLIRQQVLGEYTFPANDPPVVEAVANQEDDEGETITPLQIVASDSDTPLSYSASGLPMGLTINSATGEITGTLSYDNALFSAQAVYLVTVTVTDAGGFGLLPPASTSVNFEWAVNNVNRPPVVDDPGNQSDFEGVAITPLQIVANDPDAGDILSYADGGTLPPGLSINASSGLISGTPSGPPAVYAVTITVTDNGLPGNLSDSVTFDWEIEEVLLNQPPVLEDPGPQVSTVDEVITPLQMVATDTPGTVFTFVEDSGLPPGLSISSSGLITGTPTTPGDYVVKIIVTDDGSPQGAGFELSDDVIFDWTVNPAPEENLPPEVTNPGPQSATEDQAITPLQIVATDPNVGDTLTYDDNGTLPPGLSIDPVTGIISGTPTDSEFLPYSVTITVTDDGVPNLSDSVTFDWMVEPAPPSILGLTLINASTNLPVPGFDPIPNGAVINLATLPGVSQLNVRANPSESMGSVKFGLNANPNFRIENVAPYAMAGDTSGNYNPWAYSLNTLYTVTATGYSSSNAGGTATDPLSISFTIINDPGAPPPPPPPPPPDNEPPVADVGTYGTVADTDGLPGETVVLNGTGSFDPDGTIATYNWTVNGNPLGQNTATPSAALNDGANSVSLVVIDNEGAPSVPSATTIHVTAPAVEPPPPPPPPPTCGSLVREAETGVLNGNFEIGNDAAASGGQYVHVPTNKPGSNSPGSASNVVLCFTVAQAGTYQIKAWVYGATGLNDSFFVEVNGQTFLWDFPANTSYLMDYVNNRGVADPVQVNLPAGDVQVIVYVREHGARLDRMELELVGAPPPPPPPPPPPAGSAVTSFTLVNANTNLDIGVLFDGAVLDASTLPPAINIRANTSPNPVEKVVFALTGTVNRNHTEWGSPYALFSDTSGNYHPWVPVLGNYTLTATPYTIQSSSSTAGTPLTISFSIASGAPPGGTCGPLSQEAEAGILNGNFEIGNDAAASGGQYVHVPTNKPGSNSPGSASNVVFCFNVPEAGIYQISAWVYGATGVNDSFFVGVNGETFLWDFPTNTSYLQDYVNNRGVADPVQVSLPAGDVQVIVYVREHGARLDRIELQMVATAFSAFNIQPLFTLTPLPLTESQPQPESEPEQPVAIPLPVVVEEEAPAEEPPAEEPPAEEPPAEEPPAEETPEAAP